MTAGAAGPLRVGIVNIMPRLEAYEPLLLEPLARARFAVEPVRIRLASHAYASSDRAHLERHYVTFPQAIATPLDGLVITGAPVEELPFHEVRYWPELLEVFAYARARIASTLGLCWGGLALAGSLGVAKRLYPRKLFGVFEHDVLAHDHPLLAGQGARFACAQSRYAGIDDAEIERAASAGIIRPLGFSSRTGHTLFETPDHRFVMHLGHPEYVASRIAYEWERDRAAHRTDVDAPHAFSLEDPQTTWHHHRESLLDAWLAWIAEHRPARSHRD